MNLSDDISYEEGYYKVLLNADQIKFIETKNKIIENNTLKIKNGYAFRMKEINNDISMFGKNIDLRLIVNIYEDYQKVYTYLEFLQSGQLGVTIKYKHKYDILYQYYHHNFSRKNKDVLLSDIFNINENNLEMFNVNLGIYKIKGETYHLSKL